MYGCKIAYFLVLLFVIVLKSKFGDALCNQCSVHTNLACVSETQFQVCVNGLPTGGITSCPSGYVCSTVNSTICQLNQTDVVIACGNCNTCDITNTFACTGVETYALCLGTSTPSELIGSCAPNYYCNIGFPQICVDNSIGLQPTCGTASIATSTTTTTTTATAVSPLQYPARYCRQLQQNGRFPVGTNISSTCRQYVYCFLRGGVWSGQLYTCPGRTYFNSTSRLCQNSIPEDCSQTTTIMDY